MLNTSAKASNQGSVDYYGHKDYERDKAAGMSDAEIKKLIDADPSKMGNGGVTGQLYKQIAAGASSNNSSRNNSNNGYRPPSGGNTVQRKAGGQEFVNNLQQATQAFKPQEKGPAMENPEYKELGKDFTKQMDRETALRDNNPFGDSYNSVDFFGKHIAMAREAQNSRNSGQFATDTANKYIFDAAQSNPVNIQALDQQIRTNPLYQEAKAELSKLNTFGDRYANKKNQTEWVNPSGPKPYERPDFEGMADDYLDRIEGLRL